MIAVSLSKNLFLRLLSRKLIPSLTPYHIQSPSVQDVDASLVVRRGAPSSAPPLFPVEVGGATSGFRRPLAPATGCKGLGGWFHLSSGFFGVYFGFMEFWSGCVLCCPSLMVHCCWWWFQRWFHLNNTTSRFPSSLVLWSLICVHLVLFRSALGLCDSFVPLHYAGELLLMFGRELWCC